MDMKIMAFAALALGACSYVPVSTLVQMARFDPLSADPLGMVVRIALPVGAGIVPGSEQLRLEARRSDTGAVSDEMYILDRRSGTDGVIAYKIADADIARMADQQAMIRAWEEAVPDLSTGSLNLSLMPCQIGGGPGPNATVSATLQIVAGPDRKASAMPLLRNAPLSKLLAEGAEALHVCDDVPSGAR